LFSGIKNNVNPGTSFINLSSFFSAMLEFKKAVRKVEWIFIAILGVIAIL
jgi:hypothetical protein